MGAGLRDRSGHLKATPEGVSAGVFPKNKGRVLVQAHQLRVHDFVGLLLLQNAILGFPMVAGGHITRNGDPTHPSFLVYETIFYDTHCPPRRKKHLKIEGALKHSG